MENKLESSFLSHPGMVRKINEDCVFVDDNLGLFMISDGLGGHNAGEVASAKIIEEMARLISTGLASNKDPESLLYEAILESHLTVLTLANSNNLLNDMGATLVALFVKDDGFLVAHVGDSRAYEISKGKIKQLTHDHSFIADWIRDGIITQSEARTHSARHGITMAVGVDEDIEPEVRVFPKHERSCLLLCSDGLTDMLDDEELLAIVQNAPSLDIACNTLVDMANRNGGEDNISVILIRV
jgi:PPM family protein phosphatase